MSNSPAICDVAQACLTSRSCAHTHPGVLVKQHPNSFTGSRANFVRWAAVTVPPALCVGFFLVSCVAPSEDRISCDDILPPDEARFSDIEALVSSPGKGCSNSDCHGSEKASKGYRFDERSVIFDGFTAHIDAVYGQVASGKMPEDGLRWDDDDLRLVRSWHCNGSYPND